MSDGRKLYINLSSVGLMAFFFLITLLTTNVFSIHISWDIKDLVQ